MEFTRNIADLWQVHPFREGNTRTTMTFATHFADRNGYPLDKQLFGENAGYVRNELVKASDGKYAEPHYPSFSLVASCLSKKMKIISNKIKRNSAAVPMYYIEIPFYLALL